MDIQTFYVVKVERLVPVEQIDPDDLSSEGSSASFEGKWLVQLNNPEGTREQLGERALDIFHEEIGIAVLEDYDISVRVADAQETITPDDFGILATLDGDGCAVDNEEDDNPTGPELF